MSENYRPNTGGDYQRAGATSVTVRYTGTSKEDRDRDLEKALALFKKIINREGIIQELRDRESFRSNTERRRLKEKESKQRLRLANKKRQAREARETKFPKREWHPR